MISMALTNMGYRHMGQSIWGKPVGHTLLTFCTQEMEWTVWFRSYESICIWCTKTYDGSNHELYEDIVSFLAYQENWNAKINLTVSEPWDFRTGLPTPDFLL